jgi:hypothetical protein
VSVRSFFVRPPTDFLPTGNRALDLALDVLGGVEIAVLLAIFVAFGPRGKNLKQATND